MGKPYQKELDQMPGLYAWATAEAVDTLSEALSSIASYSLMAIGSGGSLTSAQITASLHQTCFGKLGKSGTPLEVVYSPTLSDTAFVFLTAEGKNPDILGAFQLIARREPCQLIVVCGSLGSPLARQARTYQFVKIIELGIPTGKDGFVATNSLLAFAVLLTRAYSKASRMSVQLPPTLPLLLHPRCSLPQTLRTLEQTSLSTLQRENLIVLYGPRCQAAAIDIESKFSEAALGAIQLADYRNFAHGRHHWLDKRQQSSGIIAFISADDQPLAERTLKLIPQSIPVTPIPVLHSDIAGSLSGLVYALYLTGLAGRLRGIDPGQPGVPRFGRQIYHLKSRNTWTEAYDGLGPVEAAAIRRKAGQDIPLLTHNGTIQFWKRQLRAFIQQLIQTRFHGIVCDYDGTLCQPGQQIEIVLSMRLQSLLAKGWFVGIATGRGKSVRDDLRKTIDPQYWPQVLVGFYNAAEIASLDDDRHPDSVSLPCPALVPVVNAIQADSYWTNLGEITFRQWQVTIKPSNLRDPFLWDTARRLARTTGTILLRSTHSIDFVPTGISKTNLTRRLSHHLALQSRPDHILCIGDLGRIPGNDADLLASPFGLSVDEVSSDPKTCWNLAPPGHRGVQATGDYLTAVVSRREGFSLDMKKLGLKSYL